MRGLIFFSVLSVFEWSLWIFSVCVVTLSFFLVGQPDIITLMASLIGVTALIFVAKGYVIGQVLVVVFSLFYAVISLRFRYYGEMITYLGMSAPIAILSVMAWLKHPYEEGKSEVKVACLEKNQIIKMYIYTILVTVFFYYILKHFNTANLMVSTISISTSFLASYLMLFRSPSYAIAYGANDIVLIILWVLATLENSIYFPMVICFIMFFLNDVYGFISWTKMRKRQNADFVCADKTLGMGEI